MLTMTKDFYVYIILLVMIICGLAASLITGIKVVHLGLDFPFSNLTFSVFTFPLIDCVCELWGKRLAKQTIWLGLASQLVIMLLIQLSIIFPHAEFWHLQESYQQVLASSLNVLLASLVAFALSQFFDVMLYQRIKQACQGRWLWLRTNVSTILGQILDSSIFVFLVFHSSDHKFNILMGAITVKIFIAILMTPVVYLLVMFVHQYLGFKTLAFSRG